MSNSKRSVLITGCSDGGVGAALAVAFYMAGLHVYATVRNPAKAQGLAALGIQVLTLDVLSPSSIAACVEEVPSLDILVNNAGEYYPMPVVDLDIAEAKKSFDLNLWSPIAVTQAFLPLLLKSSEGGMIVNHTSAAAVIPIPFQATYNAAKAALSMFTDNLRLEIQGFGVKVVELKSGVLKSNLVRNAQGSHTTSLPEGSIYEPAREIIDRWLEKKELQDAGSPTDPWAEDVVRDLLGRNPSPVIWRGQGAWIARLMSVMPFGWCDWLIKKLNGLNEAEKVIQS
ncbi:NAD(P)-binding protein [Annulohypoxylon moriforme]|nr:NAD(P)-binding protein [Annulohypoxylon moriforme]